MRVGDNVNAGDKISFVLHYQFSNNGQRPWYRAVSFDYVISNNPLRKIHVEGNASNILEIVENLARKHNLRYEEIGNFFINKKEYKFMETE